MSANWNLNWLQAHKGGPLPVVDQTAIPDPWGAWQDDRLKPLGGLLADTKGGGESAQGPWSDNTPVQGGGNPLAGFDDNTRRPFTGAQGTFGTTYADPGGGWNPWSLYDGREGSDGSAVDGWYNAGADTAKWQLNGKPENDRNRVWRWTLDALGGNPGGQPPERVKQVFLEQVARLKRDYAATPGMNWAGSAFSGYDRMPGTQGGQGGAAAASDPGRGRSDVPAPPQPSGSVVINGGGQPNQGGSNVAGPYPSPSPVAVTPGNQANPILNPGGAAGASAAANPGAWGGAGFVNQTDPEGTTRAYMKSHGIDPDSNGFFGDFIRKLMGNLAPMLMSLTLGADGKPAMDQLANPNAIFDPIFYGGGGTLGGNLAGFADKAQAGLRGAMGGLDPNTQASLLQNLSSLRTLGQNPYLATATNRRLDNSISAAKDYAHDRALVGQFDPKEWSLGDWIAQQAGMGNVLPGWK